MPLIGPNIIVPDGAPVRVVGARLAALPNSAGYLFDVSGGGAGAGSVSLHAAEHQVGGSDLLDLDSLDGVLTFDKLTFPDVPGGFVIPADPVERVMMFPPEYSIHLQPYVPEEGALPLGGSINAFGGQFDHISVQQISVYDGGIYLQGPIDWAGGDDPFIVLPPTYPTLENLSADTVDGYHAADLGRLETANTWALTQQFNAAASFLSPTVPFVVVGSAQVDNLNANYLQGFTAAQLRDRTTHTGAATFTDLTQFTPPNSQMFRLYNSTSAVDTRAWEARTSAAGAFELRSTTDAGVTQTNALQLSRVGLLTVPSLATGAATFSGNSYHTGVAALILGTVPDAGLQYQTNIQATNWGQGFTTHVNLYVPSGVDPITGSKYAVAPGSFGTGGVAWWIDGNNKAFRVFTAPTSTGKDNVATLTERFFINEGLVQPRHSQFQVWGNVPQVRALYVAPGCVTTGGNYHVGAEIAARADATATNGAEGMRASANLLALTAPATANCSNLISARVSAPTLGAGWTATVARGLYVDAVTGLAASAGNNWSFEVGGGVSRIGGQLSVGNVSNPVALAALDVISTTRGSRPHPGMTTAQRNALAVAAGDQGLTIWNTDTKRINVWSGTAWEQPTMAAA